MIIAFLFKNSVQTRSNRILLKRNSEGARSTVFKNHRKSLIRHCEQSELRLHFEWTFIKNAKNGQFWRVFFVKPKTCYQTVLPDRSVFSEKCQKKKVKCDIFEDFLNCEFVRKYNTCLQNLGAKIQIIISSFFSPFLLIFCFKLT